MGIFRPFRLLHKQEIETIATELLVRMEQTPKYAPTWPLDASRVAEFLGLDVVWDRIPNDEQGKIAARIFPLERLIEINEEIPELRGFLGEATIAHEIGHWVLHVNPATLKRVLRLKASGIGIKVKPLLSRSPSAIRGIEWQADYFASCLLMPRYILQEKRLQRDLTKFQHLEEMAQELGVSSSHLLYRLQDLELDVSSDERSSYSLGHT